MTAIATFTSALDADLVESAGGPTKRSVQVIGVAVDDTAVGDARLTFVVVDHDGRGRMVPSTSLVFTDDSVMPPKYG